MSDIFSESIAFKESDIFSESIAFKEVPSSKFDSEELESYWNDYAKSFNERYTSKILDQGLSGSYTYNSKGSLAKFKKFLNEDPDKEIVLKRLYITIKIFDEDKSTEKIYKLLKYIHYDYLNSFDRFISEVTTYRENNINTKNDEIFYNKTVLLRTMNDANKFIDIFNKFYNYHINSVRKAYEMVNNKPPESNEDLMGSFVELYKKLDMNLKIYHYDFYLEIIAMLNKTIIKFIDAIYDNQAGCCVGTPTFNILDIMVETLRQLNKVLRSEAS